MAIHLLYVTLFYTFLYFVINLCQNPILGIGGCLFGGVVSYMGLTWGIDKLFYWEIEKMGMEYTMEELSPLLHSLMWFSDLLFEGNLYKCILNKEAYWNRIGFGFTANVIGGMLLVEGILILFIFVTAKRKDLAKSGFVISRRYAGNQWEVK